MLFPLHVIVPSISVMLFHFSFIYIVKSVCQLTQFDDVDVEHAGAYLFPLRFAITEISLQKPYYK